MRARIVAGITAAVIALVLASVASGYYARTRNYYSG
jgi:hypothetical protein